MPIESSPSYRHLRSVFALLLVALTSVVLPLVKSERAAADPAAIALYNAYRATAGVQTVTENAAYSAADAKHALYMVRNNVIGHSEDPSKPYYSPEGHAAAQTSNVHVSSGSPIGNARAAINSLVGSPFHALNMVDPAIRQTGFGDFADSSIPYPALNYGAALDVLSDVKARGWNWTPPAGTAFPLLWPGRGATVPIGRYAGHESPDPLAYCPGYANPVGLPILVQTTAGGTTPNVSAFSVTDGGAAMQVCEIDETKASGIARDILARRNSIILIPRNPLVPGKTYTASLTNWGVTTTWSFSIGDAASTPTATTGSTSTTPATVSGSPNPVTAGSSLSVAWSNVASPTNLDWIGLYPSASTPDNSSARVTFRFTTGSASGTAPMTVPGGTPAGSGYELRLFSNNSYTRLAKSGPITVRVPASVSGSPLSVSAGGTLTVSWTNPVPTSTDWIGLSTLSNPQTVKDGPILGWTYTGGGSSGTRSIVVPADTPAGTYGLRLFANNGYTELARFGGINITAAGATATGTTVSGSPNPVTAGGTLNVAWSNVASPTNLDWIGLYPSASTPDDSPTRVTFRFTTGTASGSAPMTVPAGTPGASGYELRLFANNSYTRLAKSGPITVTAATTTVSGSPNPVTAGGTLNVAWSNVASPTNLDWIGLYPSASTPDDSPTRVTFRFTTGTASGSAPMTVPAGTAAGSGYELRLFANNSYTRLAKSGPITVAVA